MIAITCASCQKKISVRDNLAGKKGKCVACGNPLIIPQKSDTNNEFLNALFSVNFEEQRTLLPRDPGQAGQASRAYLARQTNHGYPLKGEAASSDPAEALNPDLYDFLAPAEQSDEIGRLGPYRVLQVLGAGGMGVVFRAEDPGLQRLVALKAMLPALACSPSAKERFFREARSAAALKHPNVVTIHQIGEDRGSPFLAMEFLEGESLEDRLKRETSLPLAEVLRIGGAIAEGLAAAHAKGLIHRDIKPANIWLEGPAGHVKILDFGLARGMGDQGNLTHSGTIIGTPAYMAPEQAGGEAIDYRCDLFSLGCVLYRMASGMMAFKGANTMAILSALALHQPVPLVNLNAKVPVELSDLVTELLSKKARDRPESAQVVVDRLKELGAAGSRPETMQARRRKDQNAVLTMLMEEPVEAAQEEAVSWSGRPWVRTRQSREIGDTLQGPARRLMLAGLLIICLQLLAFGLWTLLLSRVEPLRMLSPARLLGLMAASTVGVLCGLLIYVGGRSMQALESYEWSLTASWLAILPLGVPLLALPVGIWSLLRLNKPGAKECFDLESPRAHLRDREELLPAAFVPAAAAVVPVLVALLGLMAYRTFSAAGEKTIPGNTVAVVEPNKPSPDSAGVSRPPSPVVPINPAPITQPGPVPPLMTQPAPAPPPVIPVPPVTVVAVDPDTDRKAALWMLSVGGQVQVKTKSGDRSIKTVGDLPQEAFQLIKVDGKHSNRVSDEGLAYLKDCKNLEELRISYTPVTDAGLAHLKDFKNLTDLLLDRTQVTDIGLANFKECKNLKHINFTETRVGDAGLAHFKECKNLSDVYLWQTEVSDLGLSYLKDCENLRILGLNGTKVSDAGLPYLLDCQKLTFLDLTKTRVTRMKIAELKKALPKCRIFWS